MSYSQSHVSSDFTWNVMLDDRMIEFQLYVLQFAYCQDFQPPRVIRLYQYTFILVLMSRNGIVVVVSSLVTLSMSTLIVNMFGDMRCPTYGISQVCFAYDSCLLLLYGCKYAHMYVYVCMHAFKYVFMYVCVCNM